MNSFLKRALVAVVGIPFALWVIWFGGWVMAVVLAIIAALAALELVQLANKLPITATPYKAMLFSAAAPFVALWAGMSGLLLLLVAALLVVSVSSLRHPPKAGFENLTLNLFAVAYTGVAISTFMLVRENAQFSNEQGMWFVMFIMVGVWVADTAAFAVGSLFGRLPLSKTLSPNKTLEGTAAALVAAIAWGYFAPMLPDGLLGTVDKLVIGLILGAMAIFGDLSESMMKRAVAVKDSGNIFPGHGGMLDRFDSQMAVMPSVYLYLVLRGVLPL